MVEIGDIDPNLLLEAVLAWTGWQQEGIPRRKNSFIVDKFGSDEAARLLPEIQALEDDFYRSDARFVADDLVGLKAMKPLRCWTDVSIVELQIEGENDVMDIFGQ